MNSAAPLEDALFTLTLRLSPAQLAASKTEISHAFPGIKSSHRCEALARGLGFRTHAALLDAVKNTPVTVTTSGRAFAAYLGGKGWPVSPSQFHRSIARVAVWNVMRSLPKLTHHGIGVGPPRIVNGRKESGCEHHARFLESREELLGDQAIEQVLLSLALIARITPTRTIRPNAGSYRLKHVAENYDCTYPEGEKLGPRYVASGSFIAAAIHAGFNYKCFYDHEGYDWLNVNFNMSKKVVDDLDCETRPMGACAEAHRRRIRNRIRAELWCA